MRDAVNPTTAIVHNSPDECKHWPATTRITALRFNPPGVLGIVPVFDALDRWPDVRPPGWDGDIRYTLWIGMLLGSPQQLHIAGVMEFWRNRGIGTNAGDKDAGGNVLVDDQIRKNWTYDCGEMARQPQPGETVFFFVTAGDQRKKNVFGVQERSNVVAVKWPTTDGDYTFPDTEPEPGPTPGTDPHPLPTPDPGPTPPANLATLLERVANALEQLTLAVIDLEKKVDKQNATIAKVEPIAEHMQDGIDRILAIAAEVKAGQTQVNGVAEVQHNTVQKIGQVATDLAPLVGLVQSIRLAIR